MMFASGLPSLFDKSNFFNIYNITAGLSMRLKSYPLLFFVKVYVNFLYSVGVKRIKPFIMKGYFVYYWFWRISDG
jgi:hypothetical protein